MKNILVTGGAGYIGFVLVQELLQAGYNVTVIDNLSRGMQPLIFFAEHKSFHFVQGDVQDKAIMSSLVKKADAIVALAALVSPKSCKLNPILSKTLNLDSIVMLNKLRSPNQPIFFPNTNIGYFPPEGSNICDESLPLKPNSHYGLMKVEAENEIVNSKEFVVLRLASIFGPSPAMRKHLLLNYLVAQAYFEGNIVLYQPNHKRNFLHVRDIAGSFMHCIKNYDSVKNEIYNVCLDEANITKLECAKIVQSILPSTHIFQGEVDHDPDNRDFYISSEKIRKTGFVPKKSLKEGIEDLIRYYSLQPHDL